MPLESGHAFGLAAGALMVGAAIGIALATLVLEDAACIGAGVLVAMGSLSFGMASAAAAAGIFVGDLMLYAMGRSAWWITRRSKLSHERLRELGDWMRSHPAKAVWIARFTPGLRFPAYVAAGWAGVPAWRFSTRLLAAALAWAPLLVGAAMLFGGAVARNALLVLPAGAVSILGFRVVSDWRLRRRLWGRVARVIRWEFWPIWAMYLLLAPYLIWLAIRHRSATVFMASNPGMFSGGLVGESKSSILAALAEGAPEFMPAFRVVRRGETAEVESFPVVAKPDRGERGQGVRVARSREELDSYLAAATQDTILQEYVPGLEYGISCARRPGADRFEITSITHKTFPCVVGDGVHTVEDLVLRDSRAVCLARGYAKELGVRAAWIPAVGEKVQLVEIGSHSRGSVFLDARTLETPALAEAVDRVARAHPGFFIGRFDVRAESEEALRRGEFRVLELNGVAAEPVHVYDPRVSIGEAYGALARHWRSAFEIGVWNRRQGEVPTPWREVWRALR